jgi:isochorismate synthase
LATAPFLFEKLKESYAEQLPFVAYKIANQDTVKAVFQKDTQLHLVKDYTEEGFIFAPFDSEQAPVLFPRHTALEVSFAMEGLEKVAFEKRKTFPERASHKQEHLQLVNKTKEFLGNAAVSKVVIARSKTISYPHFDFLKVFQRLLLHYPKATS